MLGGVSNGVMRIICRPQVRILCMVNSILIELCFITEYYAVKSLVWNLIKEHLHVASDKDANQHVQFAIPVMWIHQVLDGLWALVVGLCFPRSSMCSFTAMAYCAMCFWLCGATVPVLAFSGYGVENTYNICQLLLCFCCHHRILKCSVVYQHIGWEWTVDLFRENEREDNVILTLFECRIMFGS